MDSDLLSPSTGGSLVVITAEAPTDDLRAALVLRGRYGSLTLVVVDRSAWDAGAPVGAPPEVPALHITRDAPFAATWNAHVARRRGRHVAVAGARR